MKIIKKFSAIAGILALSSLMASCSFASSGSVENSSKNKQESSAILEDEHNAEGDESIAKAQQRIQKANQKIEEAQQLKEEQQQGMEYLFGEDAENKDGCIIKDNVLISYVGNGSEVIIPDNVTSIASRAFWSLDSIEAVYIPSSVKTIGEGAFWSCTLLKFINADEGLETIEDTAFWSCPSLKDVNLPNSLIKVGNSSFSNCAVLTIHAPESSYAKEYANNKKIPFDNSFAEFKKNENEKTIQARQYEHEEFSEFEIPNDVTAIEGEAFQYCKSLKYINIPSNVLSIGVDAFEYCEALESVNIEDGCIEICNDAFEYCKTLSSVNIPASVEKIGDSAFDYCDENLVIHTSKGSSAEKYAIENNIKFDNNI